MIVESYVETGSPVGSQTIAQRLSQQLSSASIRSVMADLEGSGLLFSPHTSAGRMPTELGLRLFVDGLLEVGNLTEDERSGIESRCSAEGRSVEDVLTEASTMLSGLSRCAGLVTAPKREGVLKHIEFVHLGPGRALGVIVSEDGLVENRVVQVPVGMPPSALVEASNYLSARLAGRTIAEARDEIERELADHRAQLDTLTETVVAAGLASWAGEPGAAGALIVRGRSNLLGEVAGAEDLERIRLLFDELERKQNLIELIDLTAKADGVQIFIGAESNLFSLSGCSMVVAPYSNRREQVIGAIGVIGPTHLNYARIIPMVDYTAKVVGRLLG